MTSDGDFHEDQLIKLLLKNADTIDGFKRNWWSDKLARISFGVMLLFGIPQMTASC